MIIDIKILEFFFMTHNQTEHAESYAPAKRKQILLIVNIFLLMTNLRETLTIIRHNNYL